MVPDPLAPLSAHEHLTIAALLLRADQEIARLTALPLLDRPRFPDLRNLEMWADDLRFALEMLLPSDVRVSARWLAEDLGVM